MVENSRAYNSLWQVRGDAWCRLEEAADRLTRPTTTGALKEKYIGFCNELLTRLTPLEPYWAFPARYSSRGSSDSSPQAAMTSSRTRRRGSTAR
jgi:hypothetical protein